jgi:ribosome-associated protein
LNSTTLAKAIARRTLTKKAGDVVIMDLRGLTSMADYFIVCSADSDVQIKAIADAVEEGMEAKGVGAWHKELGSPNWVLLDYVDVVLHIFHRNTRPYYNLEKLWGDARMSRLKDQPPAPGTRSTVRQPRTPAPKKKATRAS